jgi:Divergent InlB B-repeat domain
VRAACGLTLAVFGTACLLGVFGGASAAAARASSGTQISWGTRGLAVLPSNANATDANADVSSVSCSSGGNCSAVGNYTDTAGNVDGLLLTETAGQWSAGIEAVLPPNAAATQDLNLSDGFVPGLYQVSCVSTGDCSAVGSYIDDAGHAQVLLLTETAGVWSAGVEAVLPADGSGMDFLYPTYSISCASPGNCAAVGLYRDKSGCCDDHSVLLSETAGSWAPGVEVALPGGAESGQIESVSCASAGNCTVVGDTYNPTSEDEEALIVTETGGSWGPGVVAPLPADARPSEPDAQSSPDAQLSSVSCTSVGNCTAVGTYNGVGVCWYSDKYGCEDGGWESEGLLLTETAGSWSAAPAPLLPADADGLAAIDSLNSVSCASPGNCSTGGAYFEDGGPSEGGLTLTETDGHWAMVGGPDIEGINVVSCVTPGNCGALNYSEFGAVDYTDLRTQTDGVWATVRNSPDRLSSVSCTSDGSCTAAGTYEAFYYQAPSHGVLVGGTPAAITLNVAKDGGGSGSVTSNVGGIDCGSTCSAPVPAGGVTLTAKPLPGSRFTGWKGGDCSGTGPCQPDADINGQTVTATFALLPWGSAAAVPGASALNLGGDAQVTSISCAGSETCAAGGYYRGGGHQAFVADESSGVWGKAVEVPGTAALNAGKSARVTSLSCGGPGNCAAGGYYTDGEGGTRAFVATEVRGVWGTAVEVPGTAALNSGKNARVTSISCATAGNCAVGGTYSSAGGYRQVFVVDERNGVWGKAIRVPGTADLNDGKASLKSISCGAPGQCAAGGYYSDGKGSQAFLAYEDRGVWGKAFEVSGTGALNVGREAEVVSVSCATAKSCSAAGTYTNASGHIHSFLVNRRPVRKTGNWVWARARHVFGTAAALGVNGFARLTAISCADAGDCMAVGQYSSPDGNQAFVVQSWNGYWGEATEVPGIAEIAGTSAALAVSCAGVGNCAIAGSDDTTPGVFVAAVVDADGLDAASDGVAPLVGLAALAVSGSARVTSVSCAKTGGRCALGGSYDDGSSNAQPFVTAP